MPPSYVWPALTVMALEVATAPELLGSAVVTPDGTAVILAVVVVTRVVALVVVVDLAVVVAVAAAPVKAHEHSLESRLGLLLQLEAQEGRPVVAVTVLLVKVAQKADAVALLALM